MLKNQLRIDKNGTISTELDNINLKWKASYSLDPKGMKDYYLPNAIMFYENEDHTIGYEHIVDIYHEIYENHGSIDTLSVSYRALLEGNKDVVYESGQISLFSKVIYHYMVIWSKKDSTWYRELEVLAKHNNQAVYADQIKHFRDQWAIIASKQGCKALTETLYSKDCVYYNQGNIYCGQEKLNQLYSYMNQPEYTVQLKKDFGVVVNPSLAYEIGTWMIPNYQDKYFVIWIKDSDGLWKMKLDSNW